MKKYEVRLEDGTLIVYLNHLLVEKLGISDENLEKIKKLHLECHNLEEKLKTEKCPLVLKKTAQEWTETQYKLQDTWGFERDKGWHKFWKLPKCECPKIDNIDSYPYQYYISKSCPLHGED